MKTITNNTYLALALFAFACFGLAPQARAVVPAPDGGYPNGNTAEGEDALYNNTVGFYNTAIGGNALFRNTASIDNTAVGTYALYSNTIGGNNTAVGDAALSTNTIGGDNTAVGDYALYSNTTGGANTQLVLTRSVITGAVSKIRPLVTMHFI